MVQAFNPSLGGRGRQISEFEACLVYKVSSRTTRDTQRNPVSKKTTKKTKQNKTKNKTKQKKGLGLVRPRLVTLALRKWRQIDGLSLWSPSVSCLNEFQDRERF